MPTNLDDSFSALPLVELPPEPRDAAPSADRDAAAGPPTPAPRWPPSPGTADLVAALRAELTAPPASPPAAPPAPPAAPAPPVRGPDPLAEFFFDAAAEAPPDAAGDAASRAGEERREFLAFSLGREEYAIEIERIREVLKAPVITEVPRAPAHVLGVIMVRGDVIAVFDPRRRLGSPPSQAGRAARVLVCDAGEGAVGLLVDAVSDVVRLGPSDVEPRPAGVGGPGADYIAGIGRDGDRMVILLDVAAVLSGRATKEAAP
jgi:purine-binding chemotaxis protein CheW